MTTKPNYIDLGFSKTMGPELRRLVEKQLLADLCFYNVVDLDLKFDWSESCIEGNDTEYLDGSLENYSGIAVFDNNDKLVAEGWMEFIHAGKFFLVYWDYLTIMQGDKRVFDKKAGIPNHVWEQIPVDIRPSYIKYRQESTTA